MKKFIPTLIALVLLLLSCGNNDDTAVSTQFQNESTITIDGEPFSPDVYTTSEAISEGVTYRTFFLRKNNGDYIHVNIEYEGNNASGTYSNDLVEEGTPQMIGTGGCQIDGSYRSFYAGYTIVVNDYGNNKYKLVLNEVVAAFIPGGGSPLNISGTFAGQFVTEIVD